MSVLGYIIIFSLIGSVVSLAGGLALLYKEKFAYKISHLLSSFAAGALLGTAFLDLLPEAIHESGGNDKIIFWALFGVLLFFLIERFIHWFHHHHFHDQDKNGSNYRDKPTVPLIMVGDSIHNFIDGVVIAATFMVDIPLGMVTTFAVAAHEIPQEVGDFGVMLRRGFSRNKVLLFNFISACFAIGGALLTYFAGEIIEGYLPLFLALTAGFFIYIAASDLIPEIHEENRRNFAFYETMLLLLGVFVIWISISLLEH